MLDIFTFVFFLILAVKGGFEPTEFHWEQHLVYLPLKKLHPDPHQLVFMPSRYLLNPR